MQELNNRHNAAEYKEDMPYRGFLMIKCEECGEVKGYCAKKETYSFRCDKCGHSTALYDLKPMYLNCECGGRFKYKTNITDKQITRNCINCGQPVDMEINKRGTAYISMNGMR